MSNELLFSLLICKCRTYKLLFLNECVFFPEVMEEDCSWMYRKTMSGAMWNSSEFVNRKKCFVDWCLTHGPGITNDLWCSCAKWKNKSIKSRKIGSCIFIDKGFYLIMKM